MALLVDASVWIAAKDSDDRYHAAARPLVLEAVHPLAALDLTFYEVANVLGARHGTPEVALGLCQTIVERCGGRLVAVDLELIAAASQLAAEHGLTAYDAAYVAAARRNGWTLVSADVADLVSRDLAVTPDSILDP